MYTCIEKKYGKAETTRIMVLNSSRLLIFSHSNYVWKEVHQHHKYIKSLTNLLFDRVPPSNLLEGMQLMEVACQKKIQRAFPIDSSHYFHYNNMKHHCQGL